MSIETPLAVLRYLKSIAHQNNSFAYIKLDQNNNLINSGGKLADFGISNIDSSKPVDQQIPQLSGLLPVSGLLPAAGKSVVVANTRVDDVQYIDIHIYRSIDYQWVVLLDTTEAANDLQSEQQHRLNIAMFKE